MKKVAIITRHAIANYGSLLQTIALQNKVAEMGCEPKVIDFIRTDESLVHSTITEAKQKEQYKNKFKLLLYCFFRIPLDAVANLRFQKFRKKYLVTTKRYTSLEQLKREKPEADIYMTGSDQVWGPIMSGQYEWAYFLDFCSDFDKKVAYAASFGKTDIDKCCKDKAFSLLARYDHLSVREESAVKLLVQNHLQAVQVIDPTLLMSADEWKDLLQMPNRQVKESYAVVYQIHNNKELEKYAVEFAEKAGVKLIRISPLLHQFKRGGHFVWAPSLGEFLSYLEYADYLITDSFHGTAFAINFNTPLVTLMPKTGTSTRNISLLKLLGLESRIVIDLNDFSLIDEPCDFAYANKILQNNREESLQILRSFLLD